MAVICDGLSVSQVAERWGCRGEGSHLVGAAGGAGLLKGLVDRSHRPGSCPHQNAGGGGYGSTEDKAWTK
jgi:hypothetical protein